MSEEKQELPNERPPLTREEKEAVEAHLRSVHKQLRENLCQAYRGWWYWHKLLKEYKSKDIGATAVVLMPEINTRENYLGLLYLDQMLRQHKLRKAIVLTASEDVKKAAELFSKNITAVVDCPRKKAEELMQFYCLLNFDKRFFCASIDEPFGRNGSRIIGAKGQDYAGEGITDEEVFVIGVYRVYPYKQLPPPQYASLPELGDPQIFEFLKRGSKDFINEIAEL